MVALHSQKVPGPTVVVAFAVVADHGHDTGQFRRHRLHRDSRRHGVPRRHHALSRLRRFLADGAAAVVRRQLSEAVPVNGVPAGHFVRGPTRIEQVLLTDGTVGPVLAGLAIVIRVETAIDAHAAFVAVRKVFLPAHAAKAAVGTVVGPLFVRHPQVANTAVVGSKLDPARDAVVRLAALPGKAFAANDFRDGESVNVVVIVLRDFGHGLLFHAGKAAR